MAVANARDNRVDVDLRAGSLDALDADVRFDVVVANLLTHTVLELAAPLVARVRPGGTLIASGIAAERATRVADALEAAGLRAPEVHLRDGWAVLVGRRTDPPTDRAADGDDRAGLAPDPHGGRG